MGLPCEDDALINDEQGQQNPKIDEHRQELLKLMGGSLFQIGFVPIRAVFFSGARPSFCLHSETFVSGCI